MSIRESLFLPCIWLLSQSPLVLVGQVGPATVPWVTEPQVLLERTQLSVLTLLLGEPQEGEDRETRPRPSSPGVSGSKEEVLVVEPRRTLWAPTARMRWEGEVVVEVATVTRRTTSTTAGVGAPRVGPRVGQE